MAPAYDPRKQYPAPPDDSVPAHDVVFVGTGWIERIDLLEQVDWSGLDLGLYGEWKLLGSRHPLRKHLRGPAIDNDSAIELYRRASIGLNLFRTSNQYGRDVRHHSGALSANPRTFELAACGVFQISEHRAEVEAIFGSSVPTFTTASELQSRIRQALDQPEMRAEWAVQARQRVAPHTYAARAAQILTDLEAFESAHTKGA